jgi:hypothetical protein
LSDRTGDIDAGQLCHESNLEFRPDVVRHGLATKGSG